MYQHREVIELKNVIWDSRIFQIVGSGYHRLQTKFRILDYTLVYKERSNHVAGALFFNVWVEHHFHFFYFFLKACGFYVFLVTRRFGKLDSSPCKVVRLL